VNSALNQSARDRVVQCVSDHDVQVISPYRASSRAVMVLLRTWSRLPSS